MSSAASQGVPDRDARSRSMSCLNSCSRGCPAPPNGPEVVWPTTGGWPAAIAGASISAIGLLNYRQLGCTQRSVVRRQIAPGERQMSGTTIPPVDVGISWGVGVGGSIVFGPAALLFIVLLYVYPLKLLAEVVANRFLWTSTAEVEAMKAAEIQGLYLIVGAAVVATSIAMAALYLRVWQTRTERHLDPDAGYEAASNGLAYLCIALVAVAGVGIAAADLGLRWGFTHLAPPEGGW